MHDDLKLLESLVSEVSFLRKLVFFQRAQIEALRSFAIAHIADLSGIDRSIAADDLEAAIRKRYDEIILKLGDTHPDIANDADIRKNVKPEHRDKWFCP